ncbi:hypothetical protein LQV05_006553 [Cryptococcus neoformans]|nr:mitochondrial GTPase 1 [Cryptococcus neoformans var. grubii]OXC62667.1 mitochondrial GTPase 1 [Cryptococcus neoformans var. grubii MW-RSA852]UOH83815.1 hypothetical protein LQV05_006553 [Cryptococcus neoformans]
MPFLPRASFPFSPNTPSWFAGHMARSLRELPPLLENINLVIEARDARLPLTSINPIFDGVLRRWKARAKVEGERERIVVYTKRDLAEARFEGPLTRAFMQNGSQKIMFADTRKNPDISHILRYAVDLAQKSAPFSPTYSILVLGMPNVGKSSLLNALRRVGLRKGKAFQTGALAGVTKKLTGTVRIYEEPQVYVYDTPGVMMPYLGKGEEGGEKGLKLALTAGIKEDLFELDAISDYLLWKLNRRYVSEPSLPSYLSSLPLPPSFEPTDHLPTLLSALSNRLAAKQKGGEEDWESVMRWFVRAWREGKMGEWTLDELVPYRPVEVLLPHEVENMRLEGETVDLPVAGVPERQMSQVELDDHVNETVTAYLSTLSSSTSLENSASASQQRKISKSQRLQEKDAKLRGKGINVKRREEWQPGGVVSGGKRKGMSVKSTMGAAGRAVRRRG